MIKKAICFVLALVVCLSLTVPLSVKAAEVPIIPSITIRPFDDSDFTITFTNVYDIFSIRYNSWSGEYDPHFYLEASGTVSFNRESVIQTSIPRVLDVGQRWERRDDWLDGIWGFTEIYTPGIGYQPGFMHPLARAGEPIGTDVSSVFWDYWDILYREWVDFNIINYYPVNVIVNQFIDDDGWIYTDTRGISLAPIRTIPQFSNLQERYARIDTHGPSDEGRRLSESAGFWEIVEIWDVAPSAVSGFSLTLLNSPTDVAGFTEKDVFVSAPDGRTLGGMFLVMQITDPGSRARPNIVQFELWDRQFAEVPIGLVRNGTNIDILLVEGRDFFYPNKIIHASVDNR